jgi:UDP-glucose 4-epimerase
VERIDIREPNWRQFDFSKFDAVLHVAGIAHITARKKV